jgi:hypothetical protein
MSADITVSKQRGRPFAAGVSGNPDGRPKGSRNKLTETFLDTVAKDFAANGAEAIARLLPPKADSNHGPCQRVYDVCMTYKAVRNYVTA